MNERDFFVGEIVRRPKLEPHVQVPRGARVDPRQAPAAEIEDLAALRTRRYLQRDTSRDHRDIDVGAERELRIGDENFRV